MSRVALVTGAAGGIGLAAATALAEDTTVVLLDRSEEVADRAAELRAAGHQAMPLVADLSDLGSIAKTVAWVQEEVGSLDVLVNNAGIHPKRDGRHQGFEETSLEDWELVMRINLTAPFLLCQAAAPGMRERGWGRIVNVASRAGRTFSPLGGTHYSASKAGVIGLTRKIAGDLAPHGITVNAVAPGQILTPLARQSSPEVLERAVAALPVRRMGTPEEIAGAIRYLASDVAGFVNGVVLDVNGGGFMG